MLTAAIAAKREVRDWTTDSRHWERYRPRAGDIIIGTSAKCGTTWTQQIVSLLVFQSTEPRPLFQLSPWLDARAFMPIDVKFATIEGQTHRRFLKTHSQLDAVPFYREVSYIHVGRYGLDAFMSWHNHSVIMTENVLGAFDEAGLGDPAVGCPYPRPAKDVREFFETWVTDNKITEWRDSFPASRYFDIERSYWAQRRAPNMLMVHYNDLKVDLKSGMRRIADFLQIDIPENVWPSLVEAATFDSMKRNSAQLGPDADRAFVGGLREFLSQGRNERWRGVLSAEEIERYEERARSELTPGLAHWLKNGNQLAGDPRESAD
ncbi:MAG TPA: sulfotransferase domain-containing protein [Rhizomicrobium sp.]|jgi:aryl sulfotransferase